MDIDSIFVGGPHNGNSYIVPDDVHTYRIPASHRLGSHLYIRTGEREFMYLFTDFVPLNVPNIADPQKGVQSGKSPFTEGSDVEA